MTRLYYNNPAEIVIRDTLTCETLIEHQAITASLASFIYNDASTLMLETLFRQQLQQNLIIM